LSLAITGKTESESRISIVELLLNQGADPNAPDNEGCRPIHHAAMKGYLETCKLLLRNRATIEVKDKSDMTPILYAAQMGHVEVVQVLLASGANPSPNGKRFRSTALSLAKDNRHKDVVELLKLHKS